ncbi:MAG: hypothetical protein L6Q92_14835 [Phycisphaerae bacterium]|nr:hypothetical protein [Phycisphaerae bacterium]
MSSMTCQRCGRVVRPTASYCGLCGAGLVHAVPEPPPIAAPAPAAPMRCTTGGCARPIGCAVALWLFFMLFMAAFFLFTNAAREPRPALHRERIERPILRYRRAPDSYDRHDDRRSSPHRIETH